MPIPSLTPNPYPLAVEKISTPSGDAFAPVIGNLPALSTQVPGQGDEATAMRVLPQKIWSAGFSDVGASVIDPKFATPFISSGTSYSQSAGSLVIVAPAVAGAEFLARSLENFKGSMRARFTSILSQRIANNNFAFLLADLIIENAAYTIISSTLVNVAMPSHGFTAKNVGQFANLGAISGAAGLPGRYAIASIIDQNTVRFTVSGWPATGSGTLTVFGQNYIRTLFNGTGATSANVDAQRNGWASGDTAISINTTNTPGTMMQMEYTGRDIFFSDTVRASSATPNVLLRASRVENIPEHDLDLYVFIWSFNGSAAPASPTTWTLGLAAVENFANTPVYIQGVRAQGGAPPLPVFFPTAQAVTLSSGTVTTVSALTGGGAAEDAAAGANPVLTGGVVRTATTPTSLVAGDAVRDTHASSGAKVVKPYAVPEAGWNASLSLTAATAVPIQTAGGASLKRHITAGQVINTGASAVDLIILDGATERWRLPLPVNVPVSLTFPTELLTTANTALNVNLSAVGTVRANFQGYTSA